MLSDRQTHTHTDIQRDTVITILRCLVGGGIIKYKITTIKYRK